MFEIICKTEEEACTFYRAFDSVLKVSRFHVNGQGQFGRPGGVDIERRGVRKVRWVVTIVGVRLHNKKGYCGNHAGPCRFERKHRKHDYLEGADWVGFNDMVNDILDTMHHDGDAGSSIVNIRKAGKRRLAYFGTDGGEFDRFGRDEHYEDCRRTASSPMVVSALAGLTLRTAVLSAGTPGINCYTFEGENNEAAIAALDAIRLTQWNSRHKTGVAEHYKHDHCPKCGTKSVPYEDVPDQALRGCPKCEHHWLEDFSRQPA